MELDDMNIFCYNEGPIAKVSEAMAWDYILKISPKDDTKPAINIFLSESQLIDFISSLPKGLTK